MSSHCFGESDKYDNVKTKIYIFEFIGIFFSAKL